MKKIQGNNSGGSDRFRQACRRVLFYFVSIYSVFCRMIVADGKQSLNGMF